MIYIYGLTDPEGNIRYVGKSTDPQRRRARHIQRARGLRTKDSWIVSLLERGMEPGLVVLEHVDPDGDWQARERHWIATLPDLTNIREGGDGGQIDFTPEVRAKISAANSRRWAAMDPKELSERNQRMHACRKRRGGSPKGRKLSAETRARMAASQRARWARIRGEAQGV